MVPDKNVTMCQLCAELFTTTFRRHHCRACGKVRFCICKYLNVLDLNVLDLNVLDLNVLDLNVLDLNVLDLNVLDLNVLDLNVLDLNVLDLNVLDHKTNKCVKIFFCLMVN